MTYQFPTDERFRKIASKIADSVTIAVMTGARVSAGNYKCRCPLGCIEDSVYRPFSAPRCLVELGITDAETWAFIRGFGLSYLGSSDDVVAFEKLGQLYRERYP